VYVLIVGCREATELAAGAKELLAYLAEGFHIDVLIEYQLGKGKFEVVFAEENRIRTCAQAKLFFCSFQDRSAEVTTAKPMKPNALDRKLSCS
jgi:hypothetical protein